MAGWTMNRLAEQQPDPRLAPSEAPGGAMNGLPLDALTLDQLLSPPGAREGRGPDDDDRRPVHRLAHSHQSQLSRIVELEIIPRLMLLHRSQPLLAQAGLPPMVMTVEHVRTLADLAVEGEAESACAYVRSLLADGATAEQIFLDLLAPCARWMGELWEEDRYSFSQVTVGLWRLQRVLHEHAAAPGQCLQLNAENRRALLAAVPGAQHTFGVSMVAEFFGRAGWDVDCEPKSGWADLRSRVSGGWFDLFGLSVSTSDSVAAAASGIRELRKASANPQLFVMVGGPMAAQMPDLAKLCGADAMAGDAREALQLATSNILERKRVFAA